MKILYSLGYFAVAARAAAVKPELPIVDLGYERHQAISYNEDTGLYNFSNIRYAQPPVGPLRFRAPQSPTGHNGVVQVGDEGRICPQAAPEWTLVASQFVKAFVQGEASDFDAEAALETAKKESADSGLPAPLADGNPYITEDCLFLDVIVPSSVFDSRRSSGSWYKSSGAPVLVWIYGGGYAFGNKAYDPPSDPTRLIQASRKDGSEGMIFVALNYRLGALGWLAGPTLQKEGGDANAGLLDQRMALEWVQDNIHLFGGDPDRVTVMGQSAGGGSIVHHITSYRSWWWRRAPFQQAITLSPGWVPVTSEQAQEDAATIFMDYLNATTLEDAQSATTEDAILANALAVGAAPYTSFGYGPVVDGTLIQKHPSIALQDGDFDSSITVMTGHVTNESPSFAPPFVKTDDELTSFLYSLFPTADPSAINYIVQSLYPTPGLNRTMNVVADIGFTCNVAYLSDAFNGEIYNYKFTVPPALHGSDVPYVFYNGPDVGDVSGGIYNGPLGPVSVELAQALQGYIVNFVKNGDPNGPGLAKFPRGDEDATMLTLGTDGVGMAPDDTDNQRCKWLESMPYA